MATHAGLDASHASKSITAWREKKPSYKGNLNRICRGTFFIQLILLGLCAFSTVLQSIFSLSFLGVLVTDLSVGAPPAAKATVCFSGPQRGYLLCGLGGHVVTSWWGRLWRGNALVLSQPAGSISITFCRVKTFAPDWRSRSLPRIPHLDRFSMNLDGSFMFLWLGQSF